MIRPRNQSRSLFLQPRLLQTNEDCVQPNRTRAERIRQPDPKRAAPDRGMHNLADRLIGELRGLVAGRVRRGPRRNPTLWTVIARRQNGQPSYREGQAEKRAQRKHTRSHTLIVLLLEPPRWHCPLEAPVISAPVRSTHAPRASVQSRSQQRT